MTLEKEAQIQELREEVAYRINNDYLYSINMDKYGTMEDFINDVLSGLENEIILFDHFPFESMITAEIELVIERNNLYYEEDE